MLSLDLRRKIAILIFLYKIINNFINVPAILALVPFNVPSRRTRTPLMFNVPAIITTAHSPLITMLRLANYINTFVDLEWSLPFRNYVNVVTTQLLNVSV